jgi:ligand-binding sensor domain-containing protein/signal transduction histidine kinase
MTRGKHNSSFRWVLLAVGSMLLFFTIRSSAVSPWSVRAWQTEQGLPENNVTGVAQTPEGYLWIATHGGLARFDGVRFQLQPLPVSAVRSNSLIRTMFLGRERTLWVALEVDRGLIIGFSDKATTVITAADGLPGFKPLVIAQAGDGDIWVGYVDGSACRISRGKMKRFTAQDGLTGAIGCWLTTDAAGTLWFAKAGNVGVFNGERFETRFALAQRVVRIAGARDGGLWICAGKRLLKSDDGKEPVVLGELPTERPGVEPSTLFEDRVGGLWIGTTAGGLFHWDGKNLKAAATSHSDITSITEDREGNIWVGTEGGGLDRLRNRVLGLHGSAAGLPFEAVRSVCEDETGTIWTVGANGALVRGGNGEWETVRAGNGWSGARATCVVSDRSGGVWIGTYRGGLVHWRNGVFKTLSRGDGLGGENVRALLVDSSTNVWIGLETPSGLQRLSNGNLLTIEQPAGSRTIRTIVEDKTGRIWLGTSDGFLFRVENEALVDETRTFLQPAKPIRAMHADADGGLWIGYAGAGVGWLRDGKFSSFGTERGLLDSYISGIESDGAGALWFTSGHGIFQVNRRELEKGTDRVLAVDFGRNESLPNLQGSYGYSPATARGRDGRLWFATRSGLVAANANRIQPNRIPPAMLIERLVLDGKSIPFTANVPVRIPPGHRRLQIEYTAFSFAAPESIRFKHKLEGWDEEWSEPKEERKVEFQRLVAGDYEFRVVARNSSGVWNREGAAVYFRVEPFLWQTLWFRIGSTGGVVGLLFWSIRSYERRKVRHKLQELERQRAVERERARIARDIHDELGTGLTQIGLLADVGSVQPANAREVEENFSKIGERAREAVRSLDEIVWAANPRNDFLPRLADYLCHLADDCFENGQARCRKEVPTGLPAIPVGAEVRHNLALAVKEALANSLKHARANTVKLTMRWNAPELIVTVEDDGVGFDRDQTRPLGNGLSNQATRMKEIGGSVEVVSVPGNGTRSVFCVKLDGAPV